MDETPNPEPGLAAEFRLLGDNLKAILRSAWESEERKKVQEEIERGLADLGHFLQDAATELEADRIGQEIKEGVADLRSRLESGEIETRVREDLMQALQTINTELDKFKGQWAKTEGTPPAAGTETTDE